MGQPVSRSVVQAFYQAFAARDVARVAQFLADDVEWNVPGPVDLFPFCGLHRGKAAVLDYLSAGVPSVLTIKSFEPEEVLIDGDQAATLSKITAVQRATGRVITYRCAHLMTFDGDRLISFLSIIDSFDVAEQLVGRRLDVYRPSDHDLAHDLPCAMAVT